MNKELFFAHIRSEPFGGALDQTQVEGVELILIEAERRGWDDRWTAYTLATVYHETAATMSPISEFGRGKGRAYGKADPETSKTYFGRGFVQLTWKDNYKKMSELAGRDLVKFPDLALRSDIATKILFEGMERGSFTGRRLDHYFSKRTDWIGARKIVNGTDQAEHIARVARQFFEAIQVAKRPAEMLGENANLEHGSKPLLKSKTAWGATISGGAAISGAVREITDNSSHVFSTASGIFIALAIIGFLGALIVISERRKRGRQFGF